MSVTTINHREIKDIKHQENGSWWDERIAAWEAGNLSMAAFCKLNKISYNKFTYQQMKRKKRIAPEGKPTSPMLVAIKLKDDEDKGHNTHCIVKEVSQKVLCTLMLGNGMQLLVHDCMAVRAILDGCSAHARGI